MNTTQNHHISARLNLEGLTLKKNPVILVPLIAPQLWGGGGCAVDTVAVMCVLVLCVCACVHQGFHYLTDVYL